MLPPLVLLLLMLLLLAAAAAATAAIAPLTATSLDCHRRWKATQKSY